MNIGIYLAHPSQYFVFKYIKNILQDKGHNIFIYIKKKDVLEQILNENNEKYVDVYPAYDNSSKLKLIKSIFIKNKRLLNLFKRDNIDLLLSAASDSAQAAFLKRIPAIIFNDDDSYYLPNSSLYGWPFASIILAPKTCSMGRYERKTIKYDAYQKTAYMHPNYFIPNKDVLKKYGLTNKKYFIIRAVSLTAHHDRNISGLGNDDVKLIVDYLKNKGEVLISSERKLADILEPYRAAIDVSDMHNLLYYAQLLISDSQSMCHEAALIGTPSIRYNDFVGKIGVLADLERRNLSIGIKPVDINKLLDSIKKIIEKEDFQESQKEKSQALVKQQIDFTAFSVWFIENYPESANIMKENPDYQYNFK